MDEKCFEILGISSHASSDEVKQAYRDLVNVWHPDRFSHNDRLRKKAEEELKKINLAYEEIRQFFFFERERQRLKAEEEERSKREAESGAREQAVYRARAKAEAEARMRQEPKAKAYSDNDWESRTLCGDGSCIGVIDKNGHCTECGKTLEEARKEEKTRSYLKKEKTKTGFWQKRRSRDRNATRNYSHQDNIPGDNDDPIDLENRVLCSDQACIGIMGSDGRCTECGRRLS